MQSDHLLHGHTLPVFFRDQAHRPPRSAEIQPMLPTSQAAAATRPYRGFVLNTYSPLHHVPDSLMQRCGNLRI